MRWMDIAWAEVGTAEIAGPESEPAILAYYRDAGRSDITNDETHWCAAFAGACLSRAGIPVDLPKHDRLRARAYLGVGTPIPKDQPRVGALVIFARGNDGWSGHVGFVTGWTDTHIKVLGGNQADAVNERWYSRARLLGLRWPELPATAKELEQAGSRTVQHSNTAWWDGVRGGLAEFSSNMTTGQGVKQAIETASEGRETIGALFDFAKFFWDKLPWVLSLVAVYFLARMLWHLGWIKFFRVEDHNTGKHSGRPPPTPEWSEAPAAAHVQTADIEIVVNEDLASETLHAHDTRAT